MAIPTVPVTCVASGQDGAAIECARFVLTLTSTEVYSGLVVPRTVEGLTDETGTVVLQVWPNELGIKSSQYTVKGTDDRGRKFLDGVATIPSTPCNLWDVVDLAAYDNFDQAMQASAEAAQSAAEADGHRLAAAGSAASASASAGTASAGAISASGSASTATTQAGISTAQAVIATAQAVIATTKAAEAAASAIAAAASGGPRNKLINGSFEVHARSYLTSFADGAYCLDRWYALTETGNVTVVRVTDPEAGSPFGIRLTQPDASPKRMGFAQVIESKNIRQYASAAMNLAARLKLSIAGSIRFAVLEHTGTADTVTRDVVNNWASATYTPSNFFIAGVNVIKTGVIAPGAATWGSLSDWSALGATTKNVILFIWTQAQVAQNVTIEANRMQYEPGVVATAQEWRPNEIELCGRYTIVKNVRWRHDLSLTLGITNFFTDHFQQMRSDPAASVATNASTGWNTLTLNSAKSTCATWSFLPDAVGPVGRDLDFVALYASEL
jgi:hypothetical protein